MSSKSLRGQTISNNSLINNLTVSNLSLTSISSGILQFTSSGNLNTGLNNTVVYSTVGSATVTGYVKFSQPLQTQLCKKVMIEFNNFYSIYQTYSFPSSFNSMPLLICNPLPSSINAQQSITTFTMADGMSGIFTRSSATIGNFSSNTSSSFLFLDGY